MEPPQQRKIRWFVDVCPPSKGNMFRFKRLVFQDIIILFIQVLESVAAAGAPGDRSMMVVSGFTQRNPTILGINPGHFDEAVTELGF